MVRRKAAVEVALFAVGGALIVGSVFAYPLLLRRSGNRVDYYRCVHRRRALPQSCPKRGFGRVRALPRPYAARRSHPARIEEACTTTRVQRTSGRTARGR